MEFFREVVKCRNSTGEYLKLHAEKVRELNATDVLILDFLSEVEVSYVKKFSEALNVDSSYVTRRVNLLEKSQLIERVKMGREKALKLSDEGRKLNDLICQDKKVIFKDLLQEVSEEELEITLKVLRTVNRLITSDGVN